MFWSDITPYTIEFAETRGLYYLYTPVFTTIFAPIFLLPQWLGPYVWNIFNYGMLMLAIWTLPAQLAPYRMKMILFLLSLILQTSFCFQYNMVVLYIFLLAFTLLEKNKPFWAVLLIMISATTKIYGVVELALLLCYPKFWRNMGYAVLCGIGLLLLPAVCTGFNRLFELYQENMENLASHHSAVDYVGLLFARGLKPLLLPNYRLVQIGVLVILSALFFWRHERWQNFRFRVQALAVLMGYIILFSDSPETHTYIIALTGYLMAFWLQPKRTKFDWVLFWLLFVNFCILPTDVLCPTWLHNYIHDTFSLDVYCMTVAWLRVIWWAVKPGEEFGGETLKVGKTLILLPLCLLLPLTAHAQDKRFTVGGETFVMKQVKGGTFLMGSNEKDAAPDERPVHRVKVKDFYIGETEVTQELWKAVMGKAKAKWRGEHWPMEMISYKKCKEFIAKLNAMTGEHFRLPTEEEWEYAARGGRLSKGYRYAGSNRPEEVGWCMENSIRKSHKPVKSLRPNELGIYDMSGSVWEWCDSNYEDYAPKDRGFFAKWLHSHTYVIRGGSYNNEAVFMRVSNRYEFVDWRFEQTIGMRLAL
jgi:formylglycine-generating enzyme required for sulfatase activity